MKSSLTAWHFTSTNVYTGLAHPGHIVYYSGSTASKQCLQGVNKTITVCLYEL